ncbi:MAG: hypothetical protein OCD01_04530 [Fibrobacterales bacterium]
MKKLILLLLIIPLSISAFENLNDTIQKNTSTSDIEGRIDSLNAKIELLNYQLTDNNPYALGTTADWGTGPFASMILGNDQVGLELGYMGSFKFNFKFNPFNLKKGDFVGRPARKFKVGGLLGISQLSNRITTKDEESTDIVVVNGTSFYGGLKFGGVLLQNYISTEVFIGPMYYMGHITDSNKNTTWKEEFGFKEYIGLTFYITRHSSFSVRYVFEMVNDAFVKNMTTDASLSFYF